VYALFVGRGGKETKEYALVTCKFNRCLFQNLSAAVRALRRCFKNVIRNAWIWAGYAIKHVIEGNLSSVGSAGLAGLDQPLGLAQSHGVNQDDVLLFGSGVEEIAGA
jgi:hypothetical protein